MYRCRHVQVSLCVASISQAGTPQCIAGTSQCIAGTSQCIAGTPQCIAGTSQCTDGTTQYICMTMVSMTIPQCITMVSHKV